MPLGASRAGILGAAGSAGAGGFLLTPNDHSTVCILQPSLVIMALDAYATTAL